MAKKALHRDSEFLVGEEKILVYILAVLFLGLFVYGLTDAIRHRFTNLYYLDYVFLVALIPAILCFQKGRSKHIYIRINKTGIYQDERLLTDWRHFLKAYITQKETVISIRDNFLLVVEYKKEGNKDGFRRKIPLTNTQNKSEEDIMAAIKFFWGEYKNTFHL